MLRLFSTVVVSTMSRYKAHLEPDQFKRRAKEATEICCDKERKSKHYESERYLSLSSKKEAQIRDFVKSFTGKLLSRKGIDIKTLDTPGKSKSKTVAGPSQPDADVTADANDTAAALDELAAMDQDLLNEMNGVEDETKDDDGEEDMDDGSDSDNPLDRSPPTETSVNGKPEPPLAAAVSIPVADPTGELSPPAPPLAEALTNGHA